METASTEYSSIRRRHDIEKSTWRTHRYFVDFESEIHVEISASNRCHNFHLDLPFKIDIISTNFPRGISTLNRWQIDKDLFFGLALVSKIFNTFLYFRKQEPRKKFLLFQKFLETKKFPLKFFLYFIIFWETKLCGFNITKFSKNKAFLIFRETETAQKSLYFRKLLIFSEVNFWAQKIKKNFSDKTSYILGNWNF